MADTKLQYDEVIATCRDLFIKKMADYGPSWRISRPQTITDQILSMPSASAPFKSTVRRKSSTTFIRNTSA